MFSMRAIENQDPSTFSNKPTTHNQKEESFDHTAKDETKNDINKKSIKGKKR